MLMFYPFRFLASNLRRAINIPSIPFLINYSITFRCNLNCLHCGIGTLQNSHAHQELTAYNIAHFLKDPLLRHLNVVVISGGEPFLKKDINEILLTFHDLVKPRVFHITTNGYLTERIIDSMRLFKQRGLKIILKISIDGLQKTHDALRQKDGSFEKAKSTIKKLRSLFGPNELPIGINQTIYEENYSGVKDVKKLASELRVSYRGFLGLQRRPLYTNQTMPDYTLIPLTPKATRSTRSFLNHAYSFFGELRGGTSFFDLLLIRHYTKGQLRILQEKTKTWRHRCMCLFTHFRMNPNGDIITCSYDTEILGNIKEENYSSILKKQRSRNKMIKVKRCGKCWLGCEVSPSWISSLGVG